MKQMKDSGIEWIGEIPASWKANTVFQLFTQVKNKNSDLQEQNLLSLSYGKIKRRSIDTTDGLLPESFDGYNIIEADDIVLRLTDLQNDHKSLRVGLATERGIVTSAYLTIRNRSESLAKYLYYYLYSFDIAKGFYGMGAGVRQGLNWDGIKWLKILTPPVPEQQRIVSFLDTECDRIDAVIKQTRASIEEYKKLKQSVITQSVTKGIYPDRPLKETGNNWLPYIPADWKLSRAGLHYDIVLGKMLCSNQISDEYTLEPYYCAADVHFDGVSDGELKQMWFSPSEKEQYLVSKGDLLVVEGGAGAGGCAIVNKTLQPTYIQNSIMIVRPRTNASIRYMRYLLEYLVKSGYIEVACNKATIPHFTKDKLANIPFAVSGEQEEIADYLDGKIPEIDALITKKNNLITELEQYKKSLIFEYVTGKKEVV